MSDHGRIEQTLTLLATPGVYEVLHAMRGGPATFAHLHAEARKALPLLRALSAAGLVISPHSGSLDIEPHGQTAFYLTAKGEAVTGHIIRLRQSLAPHAARRSGRPRTPQRHST
ncbi:hypothetical protein [Salinispora arenicola]|uniref:hypothetical protein n=1 Tax=Salinispora arenicola TaxID=168697 RepID=UPI0003634013|nr:hypothetical protein [Salinispora arenicola]